MQQKIKVLTIFSVFLFIALMACNEQPRKDATAKTDVPKSETAIVPSYDPAMDPVKVEAAFNKVLADTLNIKLH